MARKTSRKTTRFHVGDVVYLNYISDNSPENGMSQLVFRIKGHRAWLMYRNGRTFDEHDIYREASGVIDRYRLRRRATRESCKIAKYLAFAYFGIIHKG